MVGSGGAGDRWQTSTGVVELVPDPAEPGRATLYVNGVPSSPVNDDPTDLEFEYLRWMADVLELVALPAPPAPLRVLHLGGGACALARHVEAVRPGSRQVVVELDADLAVLAREVAAVPRSPLVRIQVGDARERLAARRPASAGVVVRDVFAGDTTPPHVSTREFAAEVVRVLEPGGLYLANVVDRTGAAVGAPLRSEVATAVEVFGGTAHVALVAEPAVLRSRRYGNVVLVASDRPLGDLADGGGGRLPAALERRLRGGAAPAHLVTGAALEPVAAAGRVLLDPS